MWLEDLLAESLISGFQSGSERSKRRRGERGGEEFVVVFLDAVPNLDP